MMRRKVLVYSPLLMLLVWGTGGCRSGSVIPIQDAKGMRVPASMQWADPKTLKPNTIQHQSLPTNQVKRIQVLQTTFRDVDPSPVEKWTEDFKRDQDPEREIRIYEGMAEAYTAYCGKRHLSMAAKHDVYQIVLLRSSVSDKDVLSHLNLKTLSIDDAKDVLKGYKMAPTPITVMSQ